MSEKTIIAWTDHTFNPWMGCTKVSDGCKNCYAETMTRNRMGLRLWGPRAARQVTKAPWDNVVKWNREAESAGVIRRVFTGSLCDWAEDHPICNATRPRLWDVVRRCKSLHFQMLTKRPENIARFLPDDWGDGYANVWLGTSVEDMRVADRVDYLRNIPAVVRFISYEPALGPLNDLDLTGIDWVIYGGESGPGYREHNIQWARDMRAKCDAEGVAFFFKQSSAPRTEMGIELDGQIVRNYPQLRELVSLTIFGATTCPA